MANPVSNGKRRFNSLDILLAILILVIVIFAIVSVVRSNPDRISGGDKEIEYTVKCELLDSNIANKIKVGDSIYDNETNQLLGTVTKISEPEQIKASGIPLLDITTDKINLTITVKAKVWLEDGCYSIDEYRIAAGKNIQFHSDKISIGGYCSAISVLGGGN